MPQSFAKKSVKRLDRLVEKSRLCKSVALCGSMLQRRLYTCVHVSLPLATRGGFYLCRTTVPLYCYSTFVKLQYLCRATARVASGSSLEVSLPLATRADFSHITHTHERHTNNCNTHTHQFPFLQSRFSNFLTKRLESRLYSLSNRNTHIQSQHTYTFWFL